MRRLLALSPATLLFSAWATAATIVVGNNSDVVNGDTISPASLALHPGPDGVSLREAIETANRAGGNSTITFAPELHGETIAVLGAFFVISTGVAIEGPVDGTGEPAVTIDGSLFDERRRDPSVHEPDILTVLASRFRLSGIRFRNVKHRAMVLQAGPTVGPTVDGPAELEEISITGNVFDTTGFSSGDDFVDAIRVWTDVLGGVQGASIRNVTVNRNRITGFNGNAIIVSASGDATSISDVTIDGNDIVATAFPIEANVGNGSDNELIDIRISNNRIRASVEFPSIFIGHVPITGNRPNSNAPWPPSARNVIERSTISRNHMNTHIQIDAGTSGNGGDNVVPDTVIVQNASYGRWGIFLLDGDPASSGNRLETVHIRSNTMANRDSALNTIHRGQGNALTGVTVRNSIFIADSNGQDIVGLSANEVFNTITNTSGLANINGNRNADPLLVDIPSGNLRPAANSPAIDQATADAPLTDADCRAASARRTSALTNLRRRRSRG